MDEVLAIALGSVLGIVATFPALYLCEGALTGRRQPSVAAGLASIAASFVMLSAALVAVRLASPEQVLAVGVAEAAAYLLVWAIEACRAWRDAQRGASSGERKRGEPTRPT